MSSTASSVGGGVAGSLGGAAARVRVRPVTDDEAFLLGALHLQALRRAGTAPDPGPPSHVQAFARSWQQRSADLPAWVAECDGQHVGMAICRVPMLPRLARSVPELVALEPLTGEPVGPGGGDGPRAANGAAGGGAAGGGPAGLTAEAVCLALVRAVVTWFGREGYLAVDVAPEVRVPPAVLDAARADVLPQRRISLPTRP